MFYLDTAVLVAAFVLEPGTDEVQRWLTSETRGLSISDWVETEFAAALAAKFRAGAISESVRNDASAAFSRLRVANLVTHAVERMDFKRAAELAARPDIALRSGDALHAAIASERGETLVTLDRQFARACEVLKIPVLTL